MDVLSQREELCNMMADTSVTYRKVLSDGTECELTFSIRTENAAVNVEEILHEMAQKSITAYIDLGNKIVYGTADQKEINELAAKTQPALD